MNGYTAIHYSSRQGHKEIVEYLVGAGGAVELKDSIPREVHNSNILPVINNLTK